jgi:hypothetical protein
MVDDRGDVGLVDRGRQFGRVVGVDDHDLLTGGHIGNDPRLGQIPMLQHEQRLGVGFTQQHGLGGRGSDIGQIPGPDDGRAGGIGVGGLVAKNQGHAGNPFGWVLCARAL